MYASDFAAGWEQSHRLLLTGLFTSSVPYHLEEKLMCPTSNLDLDRAFLKSLLTEKYVSYFVYYIHTALRHCLRRRMHISMLVVLSIGAMPAHDQVQYCQSALLQKRKPSIVGSLVNLISRIRAL